MAHQNQGKKIRQTFLLGTNVLLHLVSFLLFLGYFGVPSIEKYLEKQTIIVISEEQTNGIRAPAVTFSAAKSSILGWKTLNESSIGFDGFKSFDLLDHCNSMNMTDLKSCVLDDTFNLTDFLKTARLGFTEQTITKDFLDASSSSFWTEDFTIPSLGRHFTLKPSVTISKKVSDVIAFHMDANFSYSVLIHDENFFVFNQNPLALPTRVWLIKGETLKGGGYFYKMTLTKHKKLNLDHKPCQDDPKYNFNTCIKETLSQRIGCRLPFDNMSPQSICSAASQLRKYNVTYQNLLIEDMHEIVKITGCKRPCTYNEYKFISSFPEEDPRTIPSDQIYIAFWAVSQTTQIEEEVLLYPFLSLVSDFGGALGLFLGFSFMTLWQEIKGCFYSV